MVFLAGIVALEACQPTGNRPAQPAAGPVEAQPAPMMDLLIMPVSRYEAIERIELKSVIRDTADPSVSGRAARDLAHLQEMGIVASGYFKYYLKSGGGFRVKLNLYADESTRDRDWQRRYPADVQEGAEPFQSEGFFLPQKAIVFREQELLVEITPLKNTPEVDGAMRAFATRYREHARAILSEPK